MIFRIREPFYYRGQHGLKGRLEPCGVRRRQCKDKAFWWTREFKVKDEYSVKS